jgi:hypothetical protein
MRNARNFATVLIFINWAAAALLCVALVAWTVSAGVRAGGDAQVVAPTVGLSAALVIIIQWLVVGMAASLIHVLLSVAIAVFDLREAIDNSRTQSRATSETPLVRAVKPQRGLDAIEVEQINSFNAGAR